MEREREPWECSCGSGLPKYDLCDARGIFISYCCENCEKEKSRGFRPEIFSDCQYEADEPIEPEDV